MSRATDCLMDAGCLQESSPAQSVRAGTRKKNSGFARTINLWHERSRQRRELRELADDPDLLNDVGLSIYDVQHEGRKPFWRE
jgi:uncharacterized protein YjiS (DUF1127 family)